MKEEKQLTGYPSIDKPWLKYYTEDVINAKMPEQTIYEYIKNRNIAKGTRIALEYFGNRISYHEMFDKIDRCADALVALGVKEGDIVSICMPTTPEVVYLFYALSKIGAISNMIDPRKSANEIEEYVNEVKSKIFFGIDVVSEKLCGLKKNTTAEKIICVTSYETFKQPIKYLLRWKDIISTKTRRYCDTTECLKWKQFIGLSRDVKARTVAYRKGMPVTIVHTGGTTGKAKGVILSNDNINCGAYQGEICGLDFKDGGTWLDIMPIFIAYGVGNGLHLPLSMGMKTIIMPKFEPAKFDEIILKYKPNYMTSVPSHYGYLLKSNKLANEDLSFIKTPIVGGDKMDYTLEKEVNQFLKAHNCKSNIIKGYGMSEVNAAVSVCVTNDTNKLGSVGIPLSHSNIGIFDPETDRPVAPNQLGEIRISGPNVMLGYYDNKKEEKKILHTDINGTKWVHSGDLGYMDEDGILFVKGRYKEMIIRPDGFKVYPILIEEVILKHPAVSECKVVGCRDYNESQGELPKAYIILKNHAQYTENVLKEIKKMCECELAEYSLPFDYEVKEKFPVTPIGKINTFELKEEAEDKLKIGNIDRE